MVRVEFFCLSPLPPCPVLPPGSWQPAKPTSCLDAIWHLPNSYCLLHQTSLNCQFLHMWTTLPRLITIIANFFLSPQKAMGLWACLSGSYNWKQKYICPIKNPVVLLTTFSTSWNTFVRLSVCSKVRLQHESRSTKYIKIYTSTL